MRDEWMPEKKIAVNVVGLNRHRDGILYNNGWSDAWFALDIVLEKSVVNVWYVSVYFLVNKRQNRTIYSV